VEDPLNGMAPLPAQAGAPHVVGAPTPLTALIGRLEEAAEVVRLLASNRLLAVTGPAGGGKTRLALAAAQQWALAHPSARVAWVALAATAEPELVAEQFAAILRSGVASAQEWSAGAGAGGALVVLDNCEHLIEAVVDLVVDLLGTCSNLRVLVTSRTPLGLAGERRWPLPPLRTPEADERAGLLEYDAVRLFIDRARAVRPDFEIGGASEGAATVAAICRRLDGNPLAIELCAARTQVLGLSQLADALDDAGRLLAGPSRTSPPRHRSLWDALDWSHRLLSGEEAALFATLGVFAGSADLGTICAVNGSDCLDALTALVEHSLVRPTADPTGPGDGRRFELADPVRQYARRRLEQSGRAAEVRSAHLRWYARRAAVGSTGAGSAEQAAWSARLRADLPDLRSALAWAHTSGQVWTGLRLAADLAPFATAAGLHREGRAWLELVLADTASDLIEPGADGPAGSAVDRAALLARARQSAGRLAFLQCDYPDAVRRLAQAEAGFRLLADPGGRAQCLQALASIARERGDYVAAVETLEQARACWTVAGDREAADLAGIGLAFTSLLEGSIERARGLAEAALPSAYARADASAITDSLLVLGGAFLAEGDLDSAADVIGDALARAERDQLAEARAYAVEWLAVVAWEQGELESLARLLAEALER